LNVFLNAIAPFLWFLPLAAISLCGALVGWRSIRWLHRKRRHCCIACGHPMRAAGAHETWSTARCTECGNDAPPGSATPRVVGVVVGILAQAALVFPVPYEGAREWAFVGALGIVGATSLIDAALLRARSRRSSRRVQRLFVMAALLLQVPWIAISAFAIRAEYFTAVARSLEVPGAVIAWPIYARSDHPLLACLPSRWRAWIGTSELQIYLRGDWTLMPQANVQGVVLIDGSSANRASTAAEVRGFARFAHLRTLMLTEVKLTLEMRSALRSLPSGTRLIAEVVTENGDRLGWSSCVIDPAVEPQFDAERRRTDDQTK